MPSPLGKAFDIIELFERPELTALSLAEISRLLDVQKQTLLPHLQALVAQGYLSRLGDDYVMGPRFQRAFVNAVARQMQQLHQHSRQVNGSIRAMLGPLADLAAGLSGQKSPEPSRGAAYQMGVDLAAPGATDQGVTSGPLSPSCPESCDDCPDELYSVCKFSTRLTRQAPECGACPATSTSNEESDHV